MGFELCLSSRFSSVHSAYAFSVGSLRNSWSASEGSPVYRNVGTCVVSLSCSLSYDDDKAQHFFYPNHAQPGFANIGCHGLGNLFTAANIDNKHSSSHSPIHHSSAEWEVSKVASRPRNAIAGVGVPFSIQILKRKQQGYGSVTFAEQGLTDVGNSMGKAFASIMFILKELQIGSIHIRQELFEQDVRSLVNQVQEDMHAPILWLFQQVFACTPELMMLLMVLLANFTAFSMANTLPMVTTPTTSILAVVPALLEGLDTSKLGKSDKSIQFLRSTRVTSPSVGDDNDWLLAHMGNGGRGSSKNCVSAGGGTGNFEPVKTSSGLNRALPHVVDNRFCELSLSEIASGCEKEWPSSQLKQPSDVPILSDDVTPWEFVSMASASTDKEKNPAVRSSTEIDARPRPSGNRPEQDVQSVSRPQSPEHFPHAPLASHVLPSFVAPITASIEDDNYTCYDKTDLDYQYAISTRDANSMLLANYAQFLFLVRKDHGRAEELFRRALQCDPHDAYAVSQFASFLWLARRNIAAAGKAFQAAVRAEPCNSFHAADYAHFLWSSGQ